MYSVSSTSQEKNEMKMTHDKLCSLEDGTMEKKLYRNCEEYCALKYALHYIHNVKLCQTCTSSLSRSREVT